MSFFMQLSPGSAKAARQHRDGVDTTSTSALNLVDVKQDFDKFAAYFYHLILLLKSLKLFPQLLRGVKYVSITLLNISTQKSM